MLVVVLVVVEEEEAVSVTRWSSAARWGGTGWDKVQVLRKDEGTVLYQV